MILPNLGLQPQPQYPQTNVNIDFPRGVQLNVILAPGVALSTTLGPDMVEQLHAAWQAAKEQHEKEMKVVAELQKSKNNGYQ